MLKSSQWFNQYHSIKCNNEPLITINSLVKSYGNYCALDDINLTIKRGEAIALLGNSGEGKSTLAKLLCKFIQPDSGNIYYCHNNLAIAWIPQHQIRALPSHFCLFDAVAEPLVLRKKPNNHSSSGAKSIAIFCN